MELNIERLLRYPNQESFDLLLATKNQHMAAGEYVAARYLREIENFIAPKKRRRIHLNLDTLLTAPDQDHADALYDLKHMAVRARYYELAATIRSLETFVLGKLKGSPVKPAMDYYNAEGLKMKKLFEEWKATGFEPKIAPPIPSMEEMDKQNKELLDSMERVKKSGDEMSKMLHNFSSRLGKTE